MYSRISTHALTETERALKCVGGFNFFRDQKWIQKDLPHHTSSASPGSWFVHCRLSARLCSDLENQIEIGVNEEAAQEWNRNQVGYHGKELQHHWCSEVEFLTFTSWNFFFVWLQWRRFVLISMWNKTQGQICKFNTLLEVIQVFSAYLEWRHY